MVNKIIFSGTFLFVFGFLNAYSQNEMDALRYSRYFPTGTARFTAMGGAMGALGGDFSCVSNNPAGLGIFRKNQFTVSPALAFSGSNATFYGSQNSDSRASANFGNMGLVLCADLRKKKSPTEGFQFVNFGIGYTRTNDFLTQSAISGTQSESSLLGGYLQNVQSGIQNPNYEGLAMQTDLIIYDSTGGGYTAFPTPWPLIPKTQTVNIQGKGYQGEVNFALSANYANRLYLGASFNYAILRYRQSVSFTESYDQTSENEQLKSFTLNDYFTTSGGGFNLKFGAIYRVTDFFRLGASIHTPTWFTMTDKYNTSMSASYYTNPLFNGYTATAQSDPGLYIYKYNNPFRFQASAGFTIAKLFALGLEYEYTDYSAAKYRSSNPGDFNNLNSRINNTFGSGHIARAGFEAKLDPVSIRFGFNYMTSPFSASFTNKSNVIGGSAGIGYRSKIGFFADLAYSLYTYKLKYYPYDPGVSTIQAADLRNQMHNVVLTCGWNF